MIDRNRKKDHLASELADARKRIAELEESEFRHKLAEERLRASEANYRAIFDTANDAIFVHDIETGDILDVNRKAHEIYGYPPEEARKLNVEALSSGEPPFTQEKANLLIEKAVNEKPQLFEWMAKDKDGRLFWVEVSLKLGIIGGKKRLLATVRDITERKKAEQTIRQSEKRYRELYEGSRDGYAMVNMEGKILESNSVFKEMLGYTDEELLEKTYEEITLAKWHAMEAEIIENQVMKRGYSDVFAKEYRRKDGTIFPIEIRVYLIKDENGEPAGMWAFVRDITERKQAEKELKEAKDNLEIKVKERTEELRKKNEELERFVYCASHDLQAPLRAIQVFSNMLIDDLREQLKSKQHERLSSMAQTAEYSSQLVGDMLTYARLGLENLEKTDVPLKSVLNYCQFELIEDINAVNAEIKISDSLPTVKGDERMLVRLITNLLSNAIKFVPPDRRPLVEIDIKRVKGAIHFSVKDNGVGIAPEFRETVFGMFERLHSRDDYAGTGVGLAIAKKIVELHGGRIGVESEQGTGSTFWFEIPD
jgi:PAS domain S-box-containing protein